MADGPTAHEYLDRAARAFARGAETQCTASLLAGMCLSTARRHVSGRAAGSDLEATRKAAGQVLAMEDRRVPGGIAEAVCLCVLAIEATTAELRERVVAKCGCG
jgi:hypothetical protein